MILRVIRNQRRYPSKHIQRGSITHFASTIAVSGGDIICTPGTSTIPNINHSSTSPDPALARAKWDADGDVYVGEGVPFASIDTWINNCLNTGYEGRWVLSLGDAPTHKAGTDGIWHSMATDVRVEYRTTTQESFGGDFIFELRRTSDQVVILTDSFAMDVTES